MWRVADVRVRVGADGRTQCDVARVARPDGAPGYDVTYDDPRF